MSRNLVLCLDGTNNQYATANTNVVKLYGMIDKSASDQLAYYQPGIGTMAPVGAWGKLKRWAITRLDLAVAWLLEEHVTSAYRYLMRYYEPGDRIWIFGFSRGAYSARALAGMLRICGLLTPGNEELLPFAWTVYKSERARDVHEGFRRTFARDVEVHFLGLWDTVSSVGWVWNPQYLRHTMNNEIVQHVRHAVALDERRSYFIQNLWGQLHPNQTLEQVWFPGVHCDVGGGYPEKESGLSKLALQWMIEQAQVQGLRFDPAVVQATLPAADTDTVAAASVEALKHESLHGLWWIPEYLPKRVRDPTRNWEPMWTLHRGRNRHLLPGAKIHRSVFDRMKALTGYRPTNLPDEHELSDRLDIRVQPAAPTSGSART